MERLIVATSRIERLFDLYKIYVALAPLDNVEPDDTGKRTARPSCRPWS